MDHFSVRVKNLVSVVCNFAFDKTRNTLIIAQALAINVQIKEPKFQSPNSAEMTAAKDRLAEKKIMHDDGNEKIDLEKWNEKVELRPTQTKPRWKLTV